ncbi:LysR family transcriptional regulator, partial [Klebsiella pneumoniae]
PASGILPPDSSGFVISPFLQNTVRGFMLETLRNSDLVAVLPERLVRGQSGLVVVEPPLAVAGFEMLMLWHERWHRDPAHQWLRQFIVNSLEEQTC